MRRKISRSTGGTAATSRSAAAPFLCCTCADASSSARSFQRWPAWPRTQCHSTSWPWSSEARRRHRSSFSTLPLLRFQPRAIQPGSHSVIPLRRYWESVWTRAASPSPSASSARMAAVSSMRLLVVSGSPPDSSCGASPGRSSTAAQPPGPGLGRAPPSV